MTAIRIRFDRSIPWRIAQAIAGGLATLLFSLKVEGRENVPARGGALIVANHQSYLDPVLMAVRLDRPLNYMAKSELFEGRVGGWMLRAVFNGIPVRQGEHDFRAVRETIRRLRAGHLVNVYPEGERCADGEIGPMQRGVGLIAQRAGVPVVPAVIAGAFAAWPRHRRLFRRRPVRIRFGAAVDVAHLGAEEIIATIGRALNEMYESARRRNDRA
jgi:1-acyl-sn-glycerol-3-phosphate acyltransferase